MKDFKKRRKETSCRPRKKLRFKKKGKKTRTYPRKQDLDKEKKQVLRSFLFLFYKFLRGLSYADIILISNIIFRKNVTRSRMEGRITPGPT